jgi:predicted nucleotidyltransferase
MKRDEVLRLLSEHREELNEFGVKRLAIFGSVARDEAGPESDVDLLVEFDGRPVGLFEVVDLQHYLEDLLGCKVDLGTFRSLKQRLRERVLDEAVDVP